MSEDFLTSAFVKMRTVLKGTASRLLGNEAAADDALQEAFYKLWNRHYVLASESDAAALLSRTVRNEAVDTLRQRKRHPQVRIDSTDKPWNDGNAKDTINSRVPKMYTANVGKSHST